MVSATLTDEAMKAGARAVEALDGSCLRPDAAFWFLFEDEGWRLVLSVPQMGNSAPSAIYEAILRALQASKVEGISVSDLVVAKSANLHVQLLRQVISLPWPAIGHIRFTGNVINGHLIQDAYIYRMDR